MLAVAVTKLAGLPAESTVAINRNRGACRSVGIHFSPQLGGMSLTLSRTWEKASVP